MKPFFLFLPLFLCCNFHATLSAQPTALDPNFGTNGVVIADNADGDDDAHAVAIQPDGKIVVAGAVVTSGAYQFGLVRYLPTGALDPAFGTGGKAIGLTNTLCYAYGMTLQTDGKILVVGNSSGANPNDVFLTMRFNADGSIDDSFGSAGKAYTKFWGDDDRAKAVAVQSDGKIVVTGIAWNGNDYDIGLVRLSAQGVPDSTFGGDGLIVTDINGQRDEAESISVSASGDILVCGTLRANSIALENVMLVQYHSDGSLDHSFGGGDGYVIEPKGLGEAHVIQPDGKIVLAGYGSNGAAGLDFLLYRFLPNGDLDNSFGTNGKVFTHFGYDDDYGNDITLDGAGRILVCGNMLIFPAQQQAVYPMLCARYLPNGALDLTFDGDGKLLLEIDGKPCGATAVAVLPDNRVVLAGTSVNDFAVAQLNENGTPDASFGEQGIVVTPVGNGTDICRSLYIQPDGKMLVAGASVELLGYEFSMARFETNGAPDLTFGKKGKVLLSTYSDNLGAYSIGLQSDGKILLAGYWQKNGSTVEDFAVLRFYPNGKTDSTFGANGMSIVSILDGDDRPYAIWVLPNDKIVLAGLASNGTYPQGDFALLQLTANGNPDPTFGQNGKITKALTNNPEQIYAIAQQPDGKIIAAGVTNGSGYYYMTIFRFTASGAPDLSFGPAGNGLASIPDFDMGFDGDRQMLLQPDGKIVVVGMNRISSTREFAMARFWANGSLDNTFGNNGKVVIDLGDGDSYGSALSWQNGYLAVTGTAVIGGINTLFTARFNATDGAIDSAFGDNGFAFLQLNGAATQGNAMCIGADGKITVAGSYSLKGNRDFLLVRYLNPLVAVEEPARQRLIARVFPNPVSDIIGVAYELTGASEVVISLFDAAGKQIIKQHLGARQSGKNQEQIAIPSGLSSGVYQLNIQTRLEQRTIQVFVK